MCLNQFLSFRKHFQAFFVSYFLELSKLKTKTCFFFLYFRNQSGPEGIRPWTGRLHHSDHPQVRRGRTKLIHLHSSVCVVFAQHVRIIVGFLGVSVALTDKQAMDCCSQNPDQLSREISPPVTEQTAAQFELCSPFFYKMQNVLRFSCY